MLSPRPFLGHGGRLLCQCTGRQRVDILFEMRPKVSSGFKALPFLSNLSPLTIEANGPHHHTIWQELHIMTLPFGGPT